MTPSEEQFRENNRAELEQKAENIQFYLGLILHTVKNSGDKLHHDDLVKVLDDLEEMETGAELIWSQNAVKIIGRTEVKDA